MSLLPEVATIALQRLDDASKQLRQQCQEIISQLEKNHISLTQLINGIRSYQLGANLTTGNAFLQILHDLVSNSKQRFIFFFSIS
jgi:hypothetical protein